MPASTSIETRDIKACTFDCFGTLIDWSSGILSALGPLAARHAPGMGERELLERYGQLEREVEAGAYQSYRAVLAEVTRRMFGDAADTTVLADSLATWEPFADTVESLRRLRGRARLGVLSNIDDDLFEPILDKLGRPFEVVVTAKQLQSYKPGEALFREGLRRLGLEPHEVLHVAESRFHDIEPARRLGFRTAWVDRGRSASGHGAAAADLTVRSLAELVAQLGLDWSR
ncbi:MAG: haloacid dehalogenase type II [Phycisphaerales bacterium]|nr:haloacid dehalogenase type II [Phycisphaerales bacterium]